MDIDGASMNEKATGKPGNDETEESDVEMEGVDLEGDNDEQGEEGDDNATTDVVDSEGVEKVDNGEEQENLEAEELEEARRERQELLALDESEKKKDLEEPSLINMDSKMDYLVQQSDVFAHFLAGTVAAGENKKKKGAASSSGRGTKAGRLTEAEEDARMLKTADSRRRIIRVDKQPTILSSICKMHDYQIEGLNWLIKLHDHGINGKPRSFVTLCQ